MIARKKLHCVVRYYYSDILKKYRRCDRSSYERSDRFVFFFFHFFFAFKLLLEFVKRETELEKKVDDVCWTLSGPPATAYLTSSSLTSDSRVDCQLSGGK